jgi:hypothetical protein
MGYAAAPLIFYSVHARGARQVPVDEGVHRYYDSMSTPKHFQVDHHYGYNNNLGGYT